MTLALGIPSVKVAQRLIDSREFSEWMAFDKVEPILLHERLDILFSRSDWLFAEANRNRKKVSSFKLEQFLPPWMKSQLPEEKGDPDILWNKMQMIAMAFEAADKSALN